LTNPDCKKAIVGTACIICADQFTKLLIMSHFTDGGSRIIIPDLFSLVYLKNTGAAWGIFSKQTILLSFFSVIVLCFIFYNFPKLTIKLPLRIFALTLISGGICGNLIDRVFRGGVIDFLLFYYKNFQWPAFNIADSAITIGVIAYIYSIFGSENKSKIKAIESVATDALKR